MSEELIVERDGGVLRLTLNRPERLNAVSEPLKVALIAAARAASEDDDVRVVVITGSGRGFCSGADLSTGEGSPMVTPRAGTRTEWLRGRWGWVNDFRTLEKPVVSAVNGVAAGAGIALALVADIRLASDRASFAPAYMDRAILPDAGTSYLLSRAVGPNRALHLLYRGERITAEEMLRYGLVEEILPHDDLMERAHALAQRIAGGPAVATELAKRLMYQAWSSPSLGAHAEYEQFLWTFSRGTDDHEEGRRSFRENRPPHYTGR